MKARVNVSTFVAGQFVRAGEPIKDDLARIAVETGVASVTEPDEKPKRGRRKKKKETEEE